MAQLKATDMTLRDYFAARAMQSLILIGTHQPKGMKDVNGGEIEFPNEQFYFGDQPENSECRLGEHAYKIADSLMAARKVQPIPTDA
ncbi:MAG: hypothetical protein L0Z53_13375 [Acidobacteriales bacterium]|nr:hypothetical protein [Terriglobales bacterium]